jgi:hypothetical protein
MAMGATDFDAAIAAHRAEVEAVKDQMRPHYEAFLEATRQFLTATYREQLDKIAKSDPTRILELGVDGVRALKAKAQQFIARVPRFVEESLARPRFWSHLQNQDGGYINEYYKGLYHVDDNPPKRLTELHNRLVALFENIATFMVQQGFVLHGPPWTGGARPRYTGRLELSPPMLDALRCYAPLHDRLIDAYIALGTTERAKLKTGVDQLWDHV